MIEESRVAVFFDRDGILNVVSNVQGRPQSPRRVDDFELIDDAVEAVTLAASNGFRCFCVTNQPDISRGLMQRQTLKDMHRLLRRKIPVFQGIYHCPHDDNDACRCRKPKPGMLQLAASEHGVSLVSSYMIGDTWKDMQAGTSAGCTTILVRRPYNEDTAADHYAGSTLEAVELAIALTRKEDE